jgi:hypothetical protein
MIKNGKIPILALLIAFCFSGCAVVGGIFKAGVWVGALGVLIVIGFAVYFIVRASNKG